MSAPAPANRRSVSGSRRFNPLKALQPKRRLQQMLASSTSSVSASSVSAPIAVPTAASGTQAATAACTEKPADSSVPVLPAFDYCRFIELDYVPMETGGMVSMRPTKSYAVSTKSPAKGYMSTKSPERHSRTTNSLPSTPRSRRSAPAPGGRDPFGITSLSSSSTSGSCKGSECSPTKGRHQKYTSCTDNHGIRPPPPEQYLTPLQQKEVCIRHLRARLKDTVDRLQDRDTEIDELRGQLTRMQEDWVEEECHRVEAQLALKEARREIQQLKNAVDTVRSSLSEAGGLNAADEGVQRYFHDINTQNHKLENLLLSMELHAQTGLAKEGGEAVVPPGCRVRVGGSAPASVSGESPGVMPRPAIGGRAGSCSCDCSPARSLTRSSTYTKLSDQALADGVHQGGLSGSGGDSGTQDSGFVCCGESGGGVPSRADLLLEAAFLSEETANLLSCCAQTLPPLHGSLPNSLTAHSHHGGYSYSSHTLPHAARPHSLSSSHAHNNNMPHSSTYEKLGTTTGPFHCSLQGGGGVAGSASHPCLSHHHLYLHHLRETGIQTESCPAAAASASSDLDTIAEQRTFRSQACSPTSTWMSDEGEEEELDSVTNNTTSDSVTTATVMTTATEPILPVSTTPRHRASALPRSATVSGSMELRRRGEEAEEEEVDGEEEKQESEEREKDNEWQRGLSDAGSSAVDEGLSEISENMEDVDACPETADGEQEPGRVDCSEQRADPAGSAPEEDSEGCGVREEPPGEQQGEMATAGGRQGELETSERAEEEVEERQAEIEPEEDASGEGGGRRRQASAKSETPPESEKTSSPVGSSSSSPDAEKPHVTTQPRRSTSRDERVTSAPEAEVRNEDDCDDDCDANEEAVVGRRGGGGGGGASAADGGGEGGGDSGPVERSYWSRHFLVDLLAVAVPVVPTVAWLCRGPARAGQPMYHIGSLLRGCCTVALCSLRRGGGLRHYPAGGGDLGGTNI